jgi:membrane-bound serine protease (ClpP class)
MHKKPGNFIFSVLLAVLFFCAVAFSAETLKSPAASASPPREVVVITVDGIINPVTAEYIGKAIARASARGAEALVIRLDTPGGLDTSMRSIVRDIIGSPVPVIVYVAPSGARAASAGVFITMTAHVAAMSPGTNIGAAHPVSMGAKMDKVMSEKVTNDAAAYIRSLAEQRGRNARWAEDSVRKSVSITETEALKSGVVDMVAKDIPSLLRQVDGREVKTVSGTQVLRTSGVKIVEQDRGLRDRVLDLISDPSVAYILLLLGFYGLFFELTSPGAVLPGVIGGISLILGLYALQTLPVNYAGLLLILTGIILFILEVKIISYGMLTVGGMLCIVLGSLMLFDSPAPFFRLSLSLIVTATLITALFFALTVRLAYRAMKKKPVTGVEGLIGLEGKAQSDITAEGGMAALHGELWSAYSDGMIGKGEGVVVEGVSGMKLKVKRALIS